MRWTIVFGLLATFLFPRVLCGAEIWFVGAESNPSQIWQVDSSAIESPTLVGSTGVSDHQFGGLEFDGAGTLYAVAYDLNDVSIFSLYTIDMVDGSATYVGDLDLPPDYFMRNLAYDPLNDRMLGYAYEIGGTSQASLYSIDTGTAALTIEQSFTTDSEYLRARAMSVDGCGQIFLHDHDRTRLATICGGTVGVGPALNFDTVADAGMGIDWSDTGTWYVAWDRSNRSTLSILDPETFTAQTVGEIDNNLIVSAMAIRPAGSALVCLDLSDCDGNGTADRCQLGLDGDADGNQILDVCELDLGDCDGNGRLDRSEALAPAELFSVPYFAVQSHTVGDFDGDGVADSAYGEIGQDPITVDRVVIALGDGAGFNVVQELPLVGRPEDRGIVTADFDDDGFLDLAVGVEAGSAGPDLDNVNFYWGLGDGTFERSPTVFFMSDPRRIQVADFDGDGRPDIAAHSQFWVSQPSSSTSASGTETSYPASWTFRQTIRMTLHWVTSMKTDASISCCPIAIWMTCGSCSANPAATSIPPSTFPARITTTTPRRSTSTETVTSMLSATPPPTLGRSSQGILNSPYSTVTGRAASRFRSCSRVRYSPTKHAWSN